MQSHSQPRQKWPRIIGFFLLAYLSVYAIAYFIATATPAKSFFREFGLADSLYEAIEAGNVSDVQMLLQKGADPNREGGGGLLGRGGTPLIWAMDKSDLRMMKVLIDGGADVNMRWNLGKADFTPLMLVPSPQVAQLLLHAGADPQLQNAEGKTALQYAEERKLPQVVKILKQAVSKE